MNRMHQGPLPPSGGAEAMQAGLPCRVRSSEYALLDVAAAPFRRPVAIPDVEGNATGHPLRAAGDGE